MTCQSLFGVGEGLAAGVGEGFAGVFEEDLDGFDEDLDFDLAANEMGASARQRTPAVRRERSRGAFIIYKGAG